MSSVRLLTFDIETTSLDGYAVYVSWCDGEHTNGRVLHSPDSLTLWLLEVVLQPEYAGWSIFSHYGMKFDVLRLSWKLAADAGFTGEFFAGRDQNNIKGFNLRRGGRTWKFRDSYNFFFSSLDDAVKTFAPKMKKGHIDFKAVTFDVRNSAHIRYALNDSRILHAALLNLNAHCLAAFGQEVLECITLSGYAMRCVRAHYKEANHALSRLPPRYEQAVRSSYHGGMTCAFRLGRFRDLYNLDVNSMYPHVMMTWPLLAGPPLLLTNGPSNDADCLIYARVIIGDEFPFLISRFEDRTARFAGEVEGWYWGFELDAQAALGSIVQRKIWMAWSERDNTMKGFMRSCARVRLRESRGVKEQIAKRLQNSVYGKMGSSLDLTGLILSRETPKRKNAYCSAVTIESVDGVKVVPDLWSVRSETRRWSMVHNGSYVTARARWLLLKFMLMLPRERWLYCDTDSLLIARRDLRAYRKFLGSEYGQLKIDAEIDYREVRGPKAYKQKTPEGISYKIKSIPAVLHARAWDGETVMLNASRSLGVVMRGKFKSEEGRYVRQIKRVISDPRYCANGKFVNTVWQPERVVMPECTVESVVDEIYLSRG